MPFQHWAIKGRCKNFLRISKMIELACLGMSCHLQCHGLERAHPVCQKEASGKPYAPGLDEVLGHTCRVHST